MTNLTDKQKQLLQNEEVKDLILEFANWQILGMDKEILSKQLTDFTLLFAKQFEEQKKVFDYHNNEIKENDVVYVLYKDYLKQPATKLTWYNECEQTNALIYFKSKEKAEEYYLLNSPKLSIAESVKAAMNEVAEWDYFREKPERMIEFQKQIEKSLINIVKTKSK